MRLQNKIAIVTGAAHGIGRAIADLFGREGARVFVIDIDAKAGRQTAAALGRAEFLRCDVSYAAQVARAVKTAAAKKGRIDVLCNNAAYIAPCWHNAAEASALEWRKSVDISLLGAAHFILSLIHISEPTRQA